MSADGFGNWELVGELTPIDYNLWLPFTGAGQFKGGLRLTFISNKFEAIQSTAWLRAIYQAGNDRMVSRAVRLYPKIEPFFLEFPIPESLVAAGVVAQEFELKKVIRYQRWTTNDYMWTLRVEELKQQRDETDVVISFYDQSTN